MTNAERKMVLFLMYEGGADYCKKCIHCDKPSCPLYVSPTEEAEDYSGDRNDDVCINGMISYFEKGEGK